MAIHPTALVSAGAELGPEVEVGPYAIIGEGVAVGARCRIGPHAVLHPGAELGDDCTVHAHAVIADLPQDLGFGGGPSRVVVGAGTTLREGVTIHRGTHKGSATVIGARCFLMANSHVGHNAVLGDRVLMANGVLLAGYVEIGDGAFLSGNCAVHQFVRIGRLAMLGGLCAVTKDVPPFCTVRTHTLNRLGGLNVVGMRRAGLGPAERLAVKRAFGLLYLSGLNVSQAREEMLGAFPDGPAAEFAAFLDGSRRGLCGGPRDEEDAPADPPSL